MLVMAGEGDLAGGLVCFVPGCGTMWYRGTLAEAYAEAARWYRERHPKPIPVRRRG